jgi:peroxiredoxin
MKEKMKKISFLFYLIFTIGLCLMTITVSAAGIGDAMPAFSLPSAVGGKQVNSQDFKGKTLLVTFFATWCPPCRQEIPSLIKLHNKFTDRGFSVIGLSMDDKGPKVVMKLVEKENINYPILMSDTRTENAFGGIVGIPTSFLVDRNGKVIKRYPGYVPYSMLEKDIKSIL